MCAAARQTIAIFLTPHVPAVLRLQVIFHSHKFTVTGMDEFTRKWLHDSEFRVSQQYANFPAGFFCLSVQPCHTQIHWTSVPL
jgi:hypothetical protein